MRNVSTSGNTLLRANAMCFSDAHLSTFSRLNSAIIGNSRKEQGRGNGTAL